VIGLADFEISELDTGGRISAKPRPVYFPVFFMEPERTLGQAAELQGPLFFGFDASSEPMNSKAMERAASNQRPEATGPLSSDADVFQVFFPVFETVQTNAPGLRGFVMGRFRTRRLIESALSNTPPMGFNIEVRDADMLTARWTSRTRSASAAKTGGLSFEKNISIAGRNAIAKVHPQPAAFVVLRGGS